MICKNCKSNRSLSVSAKCDDRASLQCQQAEMRDYLPDDCGIGGGDYIEFTLCLECGMVQGTWPLPDPAFSKDAQHDDD
jgi:hypothetical protein